MPAVMPPSGHHSGRLVTGNPCATPRVGPPHAIDFGGREIERGRSSSSFLLAHPAYIYPVCVRSDICPNGMQTSKSNPQSTVNRRPLQNLHAVFSSLNYDSHNSRVGERRVSSRSAIHSHSTIRTVRNRIQLQTVGIVFTRLTALVHQPHAKSKVSPVRELWMNLSHVILQLTYLLDGPRRCFS
jgi:hypothetical protein